MPIICHLCGSTDRRISRFRLPDLFYLPILQLPTRCKSCLKRDHAFVLRILWDKLAFWFRRNQVKGV